MMSDSFVTLLNKKLEPLEQPYKVELADGKDETILSILKGCQLYISNTPVPIDLLPMKLGEFDVIVGMDWLSSHKARILCDKKQIVIAGPDRKPIVIQGESPKKPINVISSLRATKSIRKGNLAFLVQAISVKSELRLEDVPVVSEFPEVFPKDLPGLPPDRQIEFRIDLIPGSAPIAKAPYRLAPTEMAELRKQLQELLDKGFIRPSTSP